MKPDEIRVFFRQVQVHADSLMTCYQDYIEYKYHQTGIKGSIIYKKPIVTVSHNTNQLLVVFILIGIFG